MKNKKKPTKKKGPITQRHHASYDPEIVFMIFKAEHLILTHMQWFLKNRLSKGFLSCLKLFILDNEARSVDIPFPPPKQKKTKIAAKRIRSFCPNCDGHGWVEHDAGGGNVEKAYCKTCYGLGRIREEI